MKTLRGPHVARGPRVPHLHPKPTLKLKNKVDFLPVCIMLRLRDAVK